MHRALLYTISSQKRMSLWRGCFISIVIIIYRANGLTMYNYICAEKHKVTKSDGKIHKDIPQGYRIYSKHHHAPSMLRAEIEAHTAH